VGQGGGLWQFFGGNLSARKCLGAVRRMNFLGRGANLSIRVGKYPRKYLRGTVYNVQGLSQEFVGRGRECLGPG